jgi:hypothetical protein
VPARGLLVVGLERVGAERRERLAEPDLRILQDRELLRPRPPLRLQLRGQPAHLGAGRFPARDFVPQPLGLPDPLVEPGRKLPVAGTAVEPDEKGSGSEA